MLKRLRDLMLPPAVPAAASPASLPPRKIPSAVERRTVLLAGQRVSYTLKRSRRRRSIGLNIDERGLTVSMPWRTTEKWLHGVLQDRAHWVVDKLEDWQSRRPQAVCWVDGEAVPFLGAHLTLRVRCSLFAAPAQQRGKELWVFVADDRDAAGVANLVRHWYRQQAEPLFAERVAHYAPQLGVMPRSVRLSAAKTQWGSCTARGVVRLNEQLIRLPLRLIDYVVVHELAHLREMNHSAAFWNVVGRACPAYAKLRRELKAAGLHWAAEPDIPAAC